MHLNDKTRSVPCNLSTHSWKYFENQYEGHLMHKVSENDINTPAP